MGFLHSCDCGPAWCAKCCEAYWRMCGSPPSRRPPNSSVTKPERVKNDRRHEKPVVPIEPFMPDPLAIPYLPIKPERVDMPGNTHLIGIAIVVVLTTWALLFHLLGWV